MKKMSGQCRGFFMIMSFVAMALLTVSGVFAGGSGDKNAAAGGGAGVTTQVSGVKLAVTPQFGEQKWYPQPATSYTTNPRYPQQPAYSNVNGFPIVQNKVTMRLATSYNSYVKDYENNDLTKYMEALTNVHIDWDLLPEFNFWEKVNLMLSAGDALPDVFNGLGFPTSMLITLGTGGLLIPLDDFIERDTYNLKELFKERPATRPTMTSADGKIYGLADFSMNEANQVSMRFWINQTFLDKLGMKMPTTTEEYYQYLKAVKTRDPNGNGKADEIPLVGATTKWHTEIDGFLMNAFIYNDTSDNKDPLYRRRMYLTDNGKIDVSYNKPAWKEGLEYLHKLYAEGLLAGESFTITGEDQRALVEYEGAMLVGSLPNGGPHEFANTSGERRTHYRVLPPLKGPKGVQQAWYDEYLGPRPGRFVVTKNCKIPDIAIKWQDYCYTPDFWTRNRYGVLDRDWKIPASNVKGVNGEPAQYEEILKWGTPQTAYWANASAWTRWGSYTRAVSPDPFELEFVLWNARGEYWPYRYRKSVPRELAFTVEEARQFSELNRLIVEYVEQSLAGFVTGRLDLNRDWDKYLADINRMGLADLLKVTQSAFDRNWKATLGYK